MARLSVDMPEDLLSSMKQYLPHGFIKLVITSIVRDLVRTLEEECPDPASRTLLIGTIISGRSSFFSHLLEDIKR